MNKLQFYNALSDNYDSMVDFGSALIRRIEFLKILANDKKTALDFGCGTGIDSIALAKLGLKVHALDISDAMINTAKRNALQQGTVIEFNKVPSIADLNYNSIDLIVSLGNTAANIDAFRLSLISKEFKRLIKKKGIILFQLLNFNLYEPGQKYTISQMENENHVIERYYLAMENKIEFCIQTKEKSTDRVNTIATDLYPHKKDLFERLFNSADFVTEFYGSLALEKFEENKSKDLVVKIIRI